ncbi:MAG: DUF928 domain-containing protein [Kovacikia sp.]
MTSRRLLVWYRIIVCTLAGVLLGGVLESAIAPTPAHADSILERLHNLIWPPTSRGTASGRRRGGAIRGNCAAVNHSSVDGKELIALIPQNNEGTTTSTFPTVWFYLPLFQFLPSDQASANPAPVPVREGEFMLLDERGQPALKAPIPVKLPDQSGFGRFTLPSDPSVWVNSQGLEAGKRYNWFFSVSCDAKQPAKNPSVSGWIVRVEAPPGLAEQLQKTPEKDRYGVYITNDIWFDGFTLLSENRQADPDNWAAVLKELELATMTQAPIGVLQPIKSNP